MTAKPLGFIVIDRNGVRFQKTPQPSLPPLALGVVLGLALAMRLTRPPRPKSRAKSSVRFGAVAPAPARLCAHHASAFWSPRQTIRTFARLAHCVFPVRLRVLNRNNVLCHGPPRHDDGEERRVAGRKLWLTQKLVSEDRRKLMKAAAAGAGAAALFGGLGVNPFMSAALAEAAGRSEKPLKAAFSNAGLQATWCAQGKEAAEYWGKLFNVDVTWFDGQLDAVKQRAAIDNMASQKWDFVAIQAFGIGTLTAPVNKMIDAGIPVIDMDTLIAPLDTINVSDVPRA